MDKVVQKKEAVCVEKNNPMSLSGTHVVKPDEVVPMDEADLSEL